MTARDASRAIEKAEMIPETGRAGEWGTWTLRLVVGERGIAPGGGVRVQLPGTWHIGSRNGAKGVQSHAPGAPHFVRTRCSRMGVEVHCEIESGTTDEFVMTNRPGLDGYTNRYVFVACVTTSGGKLAPEDFLEIIYGDTANGSPGFTAGWHTEGRERMFIEVDPEG